MYGAFNQALFTVAVDEDRPDVNLSTLQPIFKIGLGDGLSMGFSEMVFTYGWEQGDFTSLPLGLKLAKLTRFGDTPAQLLGSYE